MLITWIILPAVLHLGCFPPSFFFLCVNISVEIVKRFLRKKFGKTPLTAIYSTLKKKIIDILFSYYFLALE